MKLGLAVNNLGPSQLTYYLVKNANAALAANPTLDIAAFFETPVAPALAANFATMPMYEAWGYDGVLIATTFETARKSQACMSPAARLFYVWDLEWVRPHARRSYREWASVYRDLSLSLLVRSEEHARVVERCWNRPVLAVVDDVNIDQILEVCRERLSLFSQR